MIKKLTNKQKDMIPVYLKKWLDIGYRTKTIDKDKATKAIHFFYNDILNLKSKPKIVFLDSPLACQLAANSMFSKDKQKYFNYSPYLWNWSGWSGFYDFVLNELFPEKLEEFKKFTQLCEHWKNTHYYLLFSNIAFVSDFPKEIHLNNKNDLHKTDGAALLYRDGFGLFRLNGVSVPEWAITTKNNEIKAADVMAIKNTEARREVMKKVGISKLFKDLNAKKLDSMNEYELFLVNLGENFSGTYLKMINPSTKETHIEGVPDDIKTCKDALAWRIGLKTYKNPVIKT